MGGGYAEWGGYGGWGGGGGYTRARTLAEGAFDYTGYDHGGYGGPDRGDAPPGRGGHTPYDPQGFAAAAGFGGDMRGGGRGGGGRRGGRQAREVANHHILQEEDPDRLLRLVADELPNFNVVNVATAFSKLGKLCCSRLFPRNIAADDRFHGLMLRAHDMCVDGRLAARDVANITHSVGKLVTGGRLVTYDADVQDLLAALEQQAVLVASDMIPKAVSNTVYAFAALGRELGAEAGAALEAAVVRVGLDMNAQDVGNVFWAYGELEREPGAGARAALESAVVRVGPSMNGQDVANLLWAFARLGRSPGAEACAELEAAVVRVGLSMKPQEVSITLWSYSTLGLRLGGEARAALKAAVARVGPGMKPQEVSNSWWAIATLGWELGVESQAALEAAVVRVGSKLIPQAVSNSFWSCMTLGTMPRGYMLGAEAWAALEGAVVRVAPRMNAQEASNTIFAYAKLGRLPGAEAWAALEAAVVRVAPRMNAQDVANTLWGFLVAATQGVPLPPCYPSLWQAACGLNVGRLKKVDLCNLFHAHLIHTELVDGEVRGAVTFPPWIMHEARETWMRDARVVTVSMAHKETASIIGELGVPHVVERLTDDGYFSVDVYLPDGDVALEVDGPHHFVNISVGGEGVAPDDASQLAKRKTSTRTANTELRDMFLARRHHAVVSVPWFEWDELRGREEKKVYVAEKLRGAGVRVPSSV